MITVHVKFIISHVMSYLSHAKYLKKKTFLCDMKCVLIAYIDKHMITFGKKQQQLIIQLVTQLVHAVIKLN